MKFRFFLAAALAAAFSGSAFAQAHPLPPQLSSSAGAAYTLYLDFGGFDYRNVFNYNGSGYSDGTWGYTQQSPGIVPAFDTDGDLTSFSSDEEAAIRETWVRVANSYVGFNINVTTVDPASSAPDDAARQFSYDQTGRVMHSIYGGYSSDWFGSAGGVSYVGQVQYANAFSGAHTNFIFAKTDYNFPLYMAAAGSHEDGHGLKLNHQHDETTGAEYTLGDYDGSNRWADGTYCATMGAAYYTQRAAWRQGSPGAGNANDVAVLQSNSGMGPLRDDGIGHSLATASLLTIGSGGSVDAAAAKGWILPRAATGYSAGSGVGDADAYTKDFFRFRAAGGGLTMVVHDGTEFLEAGVADPGATMRATLRILDGSGNLIGMGTEDGSTLFTTFSGNLAAGEYFAEIDSYGAYISAHEPNARYFNMGAYFLSGSGFQAVPEPATLAALGLGLLALIRRRKI